jgi:hypothetical protein
VKQQASKLIVALCDGRKRTVEIDPGVGREDNERGGGRRKGKGRWKDGVNRRENSSKRKRG